MFFSVLCSVFSVGLFSVQFLSIRGSQDPPAGTTRLLHPPPWASKINEKPIFPFRTLPKPSATFPELSGSARDPPGAAQKVPGGLSGAPAPARVESGWPQNWSPAISGSPKPLKINQKSIFSAQNPSKTSCNLPRAPWKRHRVSWSHPKSPRRTLRRPGARARGVRPASKLVPGNFWQPKTIKNQ